MMSLMAVRTRFVAVFIALMACGAACSNSNDEIDAQYKDGVLELAIKKEEPVLPEKKKIAVSEASESFWDKFKTTKS